ncbi:MAG: hypothetical protein ICV75_01365 [Nitrospiraceae bacterium]|nr:hypothetical protein [Nitrospiraceae bacterium]
MPPPLILSLSEANDPRVAGGKAAGLARLIAAGFDVPPGLCVTTVAYERGLQSVGFAPTEAWSRVFKLPEGERQAVLADCQARIRTANVDDLTAAWTEALRHMQLRTDCSWAVRSSATNEDAAQASFAGLYRTDLGVPFIHLGKAVIETWASVWQEPVLRYMRERQLERHLPAMAVILQPLLEARAAGVAYSIHPVSGRANHVAISAVLGLAAPLVDGTAMPDEYVVEMGASAEPLHIRRRHIADKSERAAPSLEEGLCRHPVSVPARHAPALSDEELFLLARRAKAVEHAWGHPVDVEWLFDATQLWLLQARPITTGIRPASELTNEDCEWSRANLKETMPEVPSPLGLSFLEYFMDAHIVSHYRRLGCRIPEGLSTVRVLHGRPYLNATLFHVLVAQLRSDPAFNVEHMGGQPLVTVPPVTPMEGSALLRAGWRILLEMRRGMKQGPMWFAEMKARVGDFHPDRLRPLSLDELAARLDALAQWLDGHEVTFGIVAGVGHCLQAFSRLLPRWLGPDWRSLLNAALQGQGTVISALQILRVADMAEAARSEPTVRQWFTADPWNPVGYRDRLAGTDFLRRFDSFLEEYGHRGVGESDVMSARIAEQPESILAVVRTQMQPPALSGADRVTRQAQCRRDALREIRRRLGWRWDRWMLFRWWYRRLTRFFTLREANRHHLMYYSTAARQLLRQLGDRLVSEGMLEQPDDVFFVTLHERTSLVAREQRDWKALVARRRAERARHLSMPVPDTIRDWPEDGVMPQPTEPRRDGVLRGLSISVGSVTGAVRLVRSTLDWPKVTPGDIVVAPVIDPGLTPLFGVAGGLIVELGGALSHGAIIAREYGLPTVANVEGAMTRLRDGQVVRLDASAGTIMEPHDS